MEDATERLAALSTIPDEVFDNPVRITGSRMGTGWMITVLVSDTHKEILWRKGTTGEFKSTGTQTGAFSHSGLPVPKMSIELPGGSAAGTLQIKYRDARDTLHGPFTFEVDPEAMAFDSAKRMLEAAKQGWLSFREWDGKLLMYFSGIMSMRGALKEIRYGLDTDTPTRVHPFTPAKATDPLGIHSGDKIHISVPKSTKFATIQLTYKDGTKSEVVRVDR